MKYKKILYDEYLMNDSQWYCLQQLVQTEINNISTFSSRRVSNHHTLMYCYVPHHPISYLIKIHMHMYLYHLPTLIKYNACSWSAYICSLVSGMPTFIFLRDTSIDIPEGPMKPWTYINGTEWWSKCENMMKRMRWTGDNFWNQLRVKWSYVMIRRYSIFMIWRWKW